jgi:hypothetical protein
VDNKWPPDLAYGPEVRYPGHKSQAKAQNLYLALRRRGFKEEAPRARTGYWGCQGLGAKGHTISVHGLANRFRCVSQISRGGGHRIALNHYGFCRQGGESSDEGCTKESQKDATRVDENGYLGMVLDRMMEYPGAPRQRTGGASSLSADEGMGSGKPCDGPEQWSEWKQEEDVAFQQYLDHVFKGDKG